MFIGNPLWRWTLLDKHGNRSNQCKSSNLSEKPTGTVKLLTFLKRCSKLIQTRTKY